MEGPQEHTLIKRLNEEVIEITKLKENIAKNAWELGKKLKEIKESKLYLAECPYFDEFCEKTLNLGKSSVYNFIRLFETYEVQALGKWGSAKLILLLSVEEKTREKIIKSYEGKEESLSFRDVEEIVKDSRSPFKRETQENLDYFIKVEDCGKSFLKLLEIVKKDETEWKNLIDGCRIETRKEDWEKYAGKKKILELNMEICKRIGEDW